jgi:hypothetical protein
MQQELLVELNRCLAHQEIDNHDPEEDKGHKDNGNDESDEDEDAVDRDNEGSRSNDSNIEGALLNCPKCPKKFPNPNNT